MFPCDKCGECCKNLNKSPVYAELDRGDGICLHLHKNLCSIYETRPLICRIDNCYELFFKDSMTKAEFYSLNHAVCIKLKNHEL
ncbi:YkgJ family cysteine cluster protein [Lacrimispora celerecrescens]|uniref:Uncharacterized protein n=1 Tax=[Clostridium] celerecrescens 18A TaxID=1286362 RepID=A0A2M8Z9L3_9FIRM|nr:hypothetical protein H171_3725 [[Clostridium] celerecrescens 18A]